MEEQQVAIASALVAVLAAVTSGYFSLRALRAQTLANRVQVIGMRNQYCVEVRRWADEACEALAAAVHLCDLDPLQCAEPPFVERRYGLMVKFSALIDRGRWFFPRGSFKTGLITEQMASKLHA